MSRRGTTPSIDAPHQKHINDLVQQKRTLEQSIQRLKEQVETEKARGADAVTAIQAKWHAERKTWNSQSEGIQALYRLSSHRIMDALGAAKTDILLEQDFTRTEKLLRLTKDNRITMFQIREAELEAQIEELQEEREFLSSNHEAQLQRWKVRVGDFVVQFKDLAARLKTAEREKEEVEEESARLRESTVQHQASSESRTSKLERVQLQLDGAHTKISELSRLNDELKQNNAEIQAQLRRWESLDSKGSGEMEALRKQKIELEVTVKSLDDRLKRQEADSEKVLNKQAAKAEKARDSANQWKNYANELQETISELEEKVKSFKKPRGKRAAREPSLQPTEIEDNEDVDAIPVQDTIEDETRSPPASPPRSRQPSEQPIRKTKGKGVKKQPEPTPSPDHRPATPEEEDEIQEIVAPRKNGRKAKVAPDHTKEPTQAHKSKGKAKAVDDIIMVDDPQTETEKQKKKPAKKAEASPQTDVESQPKAKKPPSKTPAGGKRTRSDSTQPVIAGVSASQSQGTVDEPDPDARKPKKRKINVFPATQPTLNFPHDNDSGLNIPTTLSPIKASEVPARSNSNASVFRLGGFRKK